MHVNVIVLILGFCMVLSCSTSIEQDDSKEFIVAADGFRNNLESFNRFVCHYTIQDFNAPSLKALFEDRDTAATGTAWYCTWVVRQPWERLYVTTDRNAPMGRAFAPMDNSYSLNYCTNGELIFTVDLTMPVATLRKAKGNERLSGIGTPIDWGSFGRDRIPSLGRRCSRDDAHAEFLGTAEVFGEPTLSFLVGSHKAVHSYGLWMTPRRGFWPLKVEFYAADGIEVQTFGFMTHISEHNNGRFFPERTVLLLNPNKEASKPYVFREWRVTSFDHSSPIDDNQFAIVVPAKYQIVLNEDKEWAVMTASKETVYNPSLLPLLSQELEKTALQWKAFVNRNAAGRDSGWWMMGILAGAAVIAIAIGAYSRIRHARNA